MEGLDSFKPDKKNTRAIEENKERKALITHSQEELFDEVESPPTSGVDEELTVIEIPKDNKWEDALPPLKEEDDAARWLRAHDRGDDLEKAA